MSWESLFTFANIWAIAAWAALILLPRGDIIKALIFFPGIGLLCLTYSVLLVLLMTGTVNDGGGGGVGGSVSLTTIAGVRAIFGSDGGVVIGWIHYLAFDLFVGLWIARDGDNKAIARWIQVPVLLLTCVAGPVGLLVWLFFREPAARRSSPRKGLKL